MVQVKMIHIWSCVLLVVAIHVHVLGLLVNVRRTFEMEISKRREVGSTWKHLQAESRWMELPSPS